MRLEKNKNKIKSLNQSLIEDAHPEIYTQAIMELGALVCKPKNPKCDECPLSKFCMAYELGTQEQRPYLSKKAKKKIIHYNVYIIKNNSQIYLRKRTEKLLGGMYEFPQFEANKQLDFKFETIKSLGHKKHVFTHLVWEMDVYEIKLLSKALDDWQRIDMDQLNQYPMATAHKKIANLL
jgi:A/G-specific adenine glycosylase